MLLVFRHAGEQNEAAVRITECKTIYWTRSQSGACFYFKLRFKSLAATSRLLHRTIDYSYDALSRLLQANYDSGTTVYNYGFDVAGNLTNLNGTTRIYNAANQMTNDGTNTLTFDDNGNMTSDGVNGYTWDRANRLLSHAGTSYAYDGNSNRISQTVNSVVTEYLVDTQPALSKVLRESDSTNTTHLAPAASHD